MYWSIHTALYCDRFSYHHFHRFAVCGLPKGQAKDITISKVSRYQTYVLGLNKTCSHLLNYKQLLLGQLLLHPGSEWLVFICKLENCFLCMSAKSLQLCLTLCNLMDHSSPGSSVHGISQARILERVAMSSARGLS